MTAAPLSPQPTSHPQRCQFRSVLRTEWTKFCPVRAWMTALCTSAVVFVLVAFLSASASRSGNPPVATGPGGEAVTDSYMFVQQTLAGDGALTARVTSLSGAPTSPSPTSSAAVVQSSKSRPGSELHPGLPPWAKAGLIVEPDTNQGTDYAAVAVTGSHGVRMQYDYTHDIPGPASSVGLSSPRWLRLTRTGDIITSYDATDSLHWTELGTARLARLPHTIQIGMFATSPLYFPPGARGPIGTPTVDTAHFDHVTTRGNLPRGSWTGDAITDLNSEPSASTWKHPSADSFSISGSGDIAPLVGGEGAATHWSGASIVNGTIAALLIVIVLATLFATSEYRRGPIRSILAASPRRGQLLAAKALVAGSLAFAAGAIATAIAEVITRHVLAASGNYLFPQSGPAVARVIIGTGLFLGLAAAMVAALGSIVQRTAGTVLAGLTLLVLPGVLATATSLPAGLDNWLMRLTPTAAFAIQATLPRSDLVAAAYTPANGYFPISPWASLAVLAAYTAAALGAAAWLLRRQDA